METKVAVVKKNIVNNDRLMVACLLFVWFDAKIDFVVIFKFERYFSSLFLVFKILIKRLKYMYLNFIKIKKF
jgi:hypothetical protein